MMNHKNENMDEEKSFEVIQEEGVPKDIEHNPHLVRRGLTEVSAMFDRHGKGYLDDTERALRRMDSTDRGYLGIDKVCVIFESLQAEQERSSQLLEALRTESKKSLNLKMGVIALSFFTVLLALANVGTSFAVSKLVKDTQVAHGDLLAKSDGVRLGTTSKLIVFEVDAISEDRRRLVERNLNLGLVCDQFADTITNADGSSSYTEKECSLQGTMKLDSANKLHNELNAVDKVLLNCNMKKSTIAGGEALPPGNPANKVMGQTTYKVFPSANTNHKYDAYQRVFVPSQPAQNGQPMQRSRYCDANYELAMYCPTELDAQGKQMDCLVMTAFQATQNCPTQPVICGPPPSTTTVVN